MRRRCCDFFDGCDPELFFGGAGPACRGDTNANATLKSGAGLRQSGQATNWERQLRETRTHKRQVPAVGSFCKSHGPPPQVSDNPRGPKSRTGHCTLLRSKQDQLLLNQARPVYLSYNRFLCTCHPLYHHPSSNIDTIRLPVLYASSSSMHGLCFCFHFP